MISTKFSHINIISRNWKKLADFYIEVFNCRPVPPERSLKGKWLADGTGIKNASLKGIHLLLPGYDANGPTLEIFQYEINEKDLPQSVANREGLRHLAFSVDNVENVLVKVIQNGGSKIGEVVQKNFKTGTLIFTYAADPEENIIELQKWNSKSD